jgi:hypothetical protein
MFGGVRAVLGGLPGMLASRVVVARFMVARRVVVMFGSLGVMLGGIDVMVGGSVLARHDSPPELIVRRFRLCPI